MSLGDPISAWPPPNPNDPLQNPPEGVFAVVIVDFVFGDLPVGPPFIPEDEFVTPNGIFAPVGGGGGCVVCGSACGFPVDAPFKSTNVYIVPSLKPSDSVASILPVRSISYYTGIVSPFPYGFSGFTHSVSFNLDDGCDVVGHRDSYQTVKRFLGGPDNGTYLVLSGQSSDGSYASIGQAISHGPQALPDYGASMTSEDGSLGGAIIFTIGVGGNFAEYPVLDKRGKGSGADIGVKVWHPEGKWIEHPANVWDAGAGKWIRYGVKAWDPTQGPWTRHG